MQISWDSNYLDRMRWILDHLDRLHVDCKEAVILLLIQFFNETGQEISHESLAQKSHLDVDEIEEIFHSLSDKGYLSISFQNGHLSFLLNGLAENLSAGMPLQRNLVEAFEQEFGRGLSSSEMQRILDMANRYTERRVIVALNEAASNDKRSFNYIENLLASWMRKGYSAEELENGRR